jgi:hypothetical protein
MKKIIAVVALCLLPSCSPSPNWMPQVPEGAKVQIQRIEQTLIMVMPDAPPVKKPPVPTPNLPGVRL